MKERIRILTDRLRATFISLRNPNFRIYLVAQIGSNVGTWIQITAENWLILQLTDSGLALGVTNALQFGPLVFLGLYGGVVADRFDCRRLLIATQSALALLSAAVGLLVVTHLIQLWMIWLAALLLGLIIVHRQTRAVQLRQRPCRRGRFAKWGCLEQCRDLIGTNDRPSDQWTTNRFLRSGSKFLRQCDQLRNRSSRSNDT